MKKLITLLLVITIMLPVFSNSFEAEGSGNTYEEALNNAHMALNGIVNGVNVYASTITSLTDKAEDSEETFLKEETSSLSFGNLLGVKDKVIREEEGKVTILSSIDDSSAPLYLNEARKLSTDIRIAYDQKASGFEENANRFLKLMSLLKQYENVYGILVYFGIDETDIPTLKYDITFNSMESKYQSFLISNENTYNKLISRNQSQNQAIVDAYSKIDLIRAEMDASKAHAEKVRIEQELAQQQRIKDELDHMVRNRIEKELNIDTGASLEKHINTIRGSIYEIRDLKKQWSDIRNREIDRIRREYILDIEEMRKIPFRTSELSQGKPTAIALFLREKDIESRKSEYGNQQFKILEIIDNNMDPQMKKLVDNAKSCMADLEAQEFTVTDPSRLTPWIHFDAERWEWDCVLTTKVFHRDIKIRFSLDYEEVTGKTPVKPNEDESASEFAVRMMNDVELEKAYEEAKTYADESTRKLREEKWLRRLSYKAQINRNNGDLLILPTFISVDFGEGEETKENFSVTKNDISFIPDILEITNLSELYHYNGYLPTETSIIRQFRYGSDIF